MKKSIVVTGAGGFIGANLVRTLIGNKYIVHAITRPESKLWRLQDITENIHIHPIGLDDKKSLQKLMKQISPFAIFHLATYGAYPSQQDADQMIKTNINGTYNLLESIKDINYSQCVVTG